MKLRARGSLVSALGVALAGLLSLVTAPSSAATATTTFIPTSFSFISAARGWVLGVKSCGATDCLDLRSTNNGGENWDGVALPSSLETGVRKSSPGDSLRYLGMTVYFANERDGWIYSSGNPIIWRTTDGGRSWRRVTSLHLGPYGAVFDIEAEGETAYLVAYTGGEYSKVMSSTLGESTWRRDASPQLAMPAGGGGASASIVLRGTRGWLVVGNDRGITGSARLTSRGEWTSWAAPCASVGNSYVVPTLLSNTQMAVVCQMGGFASPLSTSAPPGAKLESSWLYFSANSGRSFAYGPELKPVQYDLDLAATSKGALLLSRSLVSGQTEMVRSVDHGLTWSVVYQGGAAYDIQFLNAKVGLALVESGTTAQVIATSDAGRHWSVMTT